MSCNMSLLRNIIIVLIIGVILVESVIIRIKKRKLYDPSWQDLDTRPLPTWYDEAKIGIFIHWGLYSVPSFGSEWFWYYWKLNFTNYVEFMRKNYPPRFQYADFGRDFTAELFDPDKWVDVFKRSGAKYIVLTSKHHEGFTLFPSKYSFGWNSVDIDPHRDLVGDLAKAIRKEPKLKFGVYYSLYEWFNRLYISDRKSNFTTNFFSKHKMIPEMKDLVRNYKPDVFWADGDWEATYEYFQSTEFLAWLYNDSPVRDTIVVNDRWGVGVPCRHGDFFVCKDQYNPGVLQKHKWESTVSLDKYAWSYRREATALDYISIEHLIELLVQAISCGGNFLMDIGATKEGTISPLLEERLLQVGEWLGHNGEAIYGSSPWKHQNETASHIWYTFKNNVVYIICTKWPRHNNLTVKSLEKLFVENRTTVHMLASKELKWSFSADNGNVNIIFPDKAEVKVKWAWVLKIEN